MRHLMGYVVIAAAIGLGGASVAAAAEPAAAPPRVARAAASVAAVRALAPPPHEQAPSNLDPARGRVGTNPLAFPHDAVGWRDGAPHHTWRGDDAN